MKNYIIYDDDLDGWSSAWVVNHHLKEEKDNEIYFHCMSHTSSRREYNYKPELNSDLWIVDYSFDYDTMFKLCKEHNKVRLLDHHKTFFDTALKLSEIFPNFEYYYDENHCSCIICWDYFNGSGADAPEFLNIIEDRDIWKWKLPYTKELNAALNIIPREIKEWDNLYENWGATLCESLLSNGKCIVKHTQDMVDLLFQEVRFINFMGFDIPSVNSPIYQSELCHKMLDKFQNMPFSMCYFIKSSGKTVVSLRSRGDFDVSKLAVKLGGGGHSAAAGAVTDLKIV